MTDKHPSSTRRGRRLREQKLRASDYLCETCRAEGRLQEAVTVHHLRPLEAGGDPYPGLDSLVALCEDHHKLTHGSRPKVRVDPKTGLLYHLS